MVIQMNHADLKHKIKTIAILTGLTTFAIHIMNKVQYSYYTARNYLRNSKSNFYEWRFGKIHYMKKGSGAPLLLIHDLTTGSSLYEFNKITDPLSINHQVYCLDLLGYGLSEKPDMTYTNYLYVQLVIDFIKNVIGKKTDIIVTGDSVPIVVMACHNDPEVINQMIFINPQSLYEANKIPSRQTKAFKILLSTPVIGTFIYNLLANRNTIEKTFEEKYFYNTVNIEEKDILSYLEASHLPDYCSKYVFASYIGKYINTNIIHALKETNHSIYIISGEDEEDIRTTVENYIYYNSSIESGYIPHAKHLPHMEVPDKVLNHIKLFLGA